MRLARSIFALALAGTALAAGPALAVSGSTSTIPPNAPEMHSVGESLIYLNGINHVFVVDPVSFKVIQDIPMHGMTQAFATSDDTRTMYVLDGQRELIEVIDRPTGKHLGTLSFSQPGRAKAHVYALAVKGNRLYAYLNTTRFDGIEPGKQDHFYLAEPQIVAMDLRTQKKVGSVPMPLGVLYMQPIGNGDHLYAVGRDLYDIDTRTMKARVRVPLVEPAMEGEGTVVMYAEWVHGECSDDVTAYPYWTVDPITNRTMTGMGTLDDRTGAFDHFELGPPIGNQYPFSAVATADRKKAYMTMNQFFEVDLQRKRVTRHKDFGTTFYAVNVAPDGSAVYLASAGASLAEVDPKTLEIRRRIELPAECFDITILPAAGGPKPPAR